MILMSADEQLKVDEIGRRLGCTGQTVREAIHAFEQEGVGCLARKSSARPDDQRAFDDAAREALRERIRQSPRAYGYDQSLWNLATLAEASHREGLTDRVMSAQTVSDTLRSMGIHWRRVRQWINSPDPHYEVKKSAVTG
jgi:transposase